MFDHRHNQFAPKWLRRASWLALVALAWMQLGFAGHQFEHSAASTDACDACVQFERLDHGLSAEAAEAEIPCCPTALPVLEPASPVARSAVHNFKPRAPPFS